MVRYEDLRQPDEGATTPGALRDQRACVRTRSERFCALSRHQTPGAPHLAFEMWDTEDLTLKPLRAKPASMASSYGTAEPVPFQEERLFG
jgi:hypothetical protein